MGNDVGGGRRIAGLDLLRVGGMLGVFAYLVQHHLPAAVRGAAAYGWLGAGPLFMVSGFVICLAGWDRSPGEFLRNRGKRLLPALPLGIPALLLAHGAGSGLLQAELLFYAFFALLLGFGLTRRHAVRAGYVWLIAAVLAMTGEHNVVRILLQPELAGFFAGGLAFALIRRFGADITLVGLAAVSWVLSVHFTVDRMTHRLQHELLGAAAVTVFFGLMAWFALQKNPWRARTGPLGKAVYPFSLLAPAAPWLITHVDARWHPVLLVPAGLMAIAGAATAIRKPARVRRAVSAAP